LVSAELLFYTLIEVIAPNLEKTILMISSVTPCGRPLKCKIFDFISFFGSWFTGFVEGYLILRVTESIF
jgi:hypothetical protein